MPKLEQYTIDEARARAEELGKEWTPQLEQSLRRQGKIIDLMPRDTVSVFDAPPRRPSLDPELFLESQARSYAEANRPIIGYSDRTDPDLAYQSTLGGHPRDVIDVRRENRADPIAHDNPQDPLTRMAYAAGDAGFFGSGRGLPPTLPPPEGKLSEFSDFAGSMLPVGFEFAMLTPVASALTPARLTTAIAAGLESAGVAPAVAAQTAAGLARNPMLFGGHEAMSGGDAGSIATSTATGAALGGLGLVPGVQALSRLPGGQTATGYGTLYGMHILAGEDPEQAAFKAAAEYAGLKAGEGFLGPLGHPAARTNTETAEAAKLARERAARVGSSPYVPAVVEARPELPPNANLNLNVDAPIPMGPVAPRRGRGATPLLTGGEPVVYAEPRPAPAPEPRPAPLVPEQSGYPAPRVEVGRRQFRVPNEQNTPEVQADMTAAGQQNARAGRYQLERGRRMTPEQAANEYQRTRTVTTDMLGGQQLYEWLTGKVGEVRESARAASERRTAERQQRISDIADKMVESWRNDPNSAWWMWTDAKPSVVPQDKLTISTPGAQKNVAPIDGIPFTKHMTDFLAGQIDVVEMTRRVTADPSFTELPQSVRDLVLSGDTRAISNLSLNMRDRRRNVQDAGGGDPNNAFTENMIRVGEIAEFVRDKMNYDMRVEAEGILSESGITRKSGDAERLYDVLANTRTGETAAQVVAKPEVQAALSGAANPTGVVDAAVRLRPFFDAQAQMRNDINVATGGKAWEAKEAYVPEVEKGVEWGKNPVQWPSAARQKIERATRPNPGMVQPASNPRVFSPREMRRTGSISRDRLERDMFKVLGDYIADTSRKVSNSIALTSGQNVVDVVRSEAKAAEKAGDSAKANELRRTASGLEAINQYSYNGKMNMPGVAGASFKALSGSRAGMGILQTSLALKRAFNLSKYTLPIPFIVLRQWTSAGLLEGQGTITPAMMARALKRMGTKSLWTEFNNSYAGTVKGQARGKIRRQGMLDADSLDASPLNAGKSVREGIMSVVDYPIQTMEKMTGAFAYSMALEIAAKMKMPPERAARFASDVVGATQSFYDSVNRAPILSDPLTNLLFPAQSFAVESLNNAWDVMVRGRAGMSGQKLTPQQRAGRMAMMLSAMLINNLVGVYVNSYKKGDDGEITPEILGEDVITTLGNYAPYANALNNKSPSGGLTYPGTLAKDADLAAKYMKKGEYDRAFSTMAKDLLAGGATARRAMEALRLHDEGYITDDELPTAMALGWWVTPSGTKLMAQYKHYNPDGGAAVAPPSGRRRPQAPRRPSSNRPARRPRR